MATSQETDLQELIDNLKLNNPGDINILLLGGWSVGKSTFINSIANYLTYTDFEEASKECLLTLVPSKFNIRDKYGRYHIVQTSTNKDHQKEYLETEASATNDVKIYALPICGGQTKIRLIDTPGIGDSRGIGQDDTNCEKILSHVDHLDVLHAICLMIKPTNKRLTQSFSYYTSQILSRLDKYASKNIIFVFTNTRCTDYGPGDSFPTLQRFVMEIEERSPNIKIPLDRNIFCFDNEAFRYLAATKQNIEFDDFAKERFKESWNKSVEQFCGLISYIVGDAENPALTPHFITTTSTINEARRLIIQLAQPLADITQLINDNLLALQKHEQHLNIYISLNTSLEELIKRLYIPIINFDVNKLAHPRLVCASSICAELYKVGDNNKWHYEYKQICHDPCYLPNAPKEIIGSPELKHCPVMDANGRCKMCKCLFSVHMHIYYMTKTKEDQIIDDTVQKDIHDKERVMKNAKKLLGDISQRKSELKKEYDIIVKCCGLFTHFLQNNAISPFSDFYKEYIEYLITRERSLGVMAKMATVQQLRKLLNEYEEVKISFDELVKLHKKLGDSDVFITPQKIQDSIQDLYKLKHNGKTIKELYECQETSRNKEQKYTECVHKEVSTKSSDSKGTKKKEKEDNNKSGNKNKEDKSDNKNKDIDNTTKQDKNKIEKTKPQLNVKYENQRLDQASRRTRSLLPSSLSHHPRYGHKSYQHLPPPPMPSHVPGCSTLPTHDSYGPPYRANYFSKDEVTSTSGFNISVNNNTNYYHDSVTQGSHLQPHDHHPSPLHSYHPSPNQYLGSHHEPYSPQHQAYPPHLRDYQPQRGAYQPYRGDYQPYRGAYQRNRGAYQRNRGAYQPNRGAYQPHRGVYQPHRGAHQPHREAYQPHRGAYQPHRGAYNPPCKSDTPPPHYGHSSSQSLNYDVSGDRPQRYGSTENLGGNGGWRRGYRGGRNRGAYNKQKFKRDNQEKGNKGDDSNDSFSTSSSSSSTT